MTNFNEGDEVFIIGGSWNQQLSRSDVVRVTKTQAILRDGAKYNRTTGRKVGANEWSSNRIKLPTPALEKQHHRQKIRDAAEALGSATRRFLSVQGASPDAIRTAYAAWHALVETDPA